MQSQGPHPKLQLCVAGGYIIQLECGVFAWFLGQFAESLTIPLLLLFLAKKC